MKVYGPLEQAGLEIVDSLPTDTFEGREVLLDDGNIYTFFEGEWKLTGSLTQAVKTVPSADPLDDAGDILGLDVDGQINSGFIRDTDKLPDQSGASPGQVLTTDGTDATWEDPTGTGGGLEVEYRDADFTAEFGKHYLVDTENNVVNVTLPSIAAVPVEEQGNAKIRFSDEGRSWHVNPMNLIPDPADKIYDADVGETYECNVMMTWIQIQRSADNIWNMDHVFQPIEQTGGEGGAAAGINYIIDGGDAEEGVLDVEVVGDGTIEGETVSPLIGESSYLARVNSSVTVQPKYRLAINEIDLAFLDATKLKGRGLFVTDSEGWKVRLIDASDDSVVTGTEVELPLGRTTISFGNVPETGKSYKYELYAETAPADATCTYDQLFYGFNETGAADLNGWKQYINDGVTEDFDFAVLPAGWSLTEASITPFKDSITGRWSAYFSITASATAWTGSRTFDVVGMEPSRFQAFETQNNDDSCFVSAQSGDTRFNIARSNLASNVWLFGTIDLVGKPTWADYEPTGVALTNETLNANARVRYISDVATGTTLSNGETIPYNLIDDTPSFENVGNWIADSDGTITIPVSGTYNVTVSYNASPKWTVLHIITLFIDSGSGFIARRRMTQTEPEAQLAQGNATVFLNAGDRIRLTNDNTDTDIFNSSTSTWLEVTRVQDFTSETTVVADLATKNTAGFVERYDDTGSEQVTGVMNNGRGTIEQQPIFEWNVVGNIVFVEVSVGCTYTGGGSGESFTSSLPASMPKPIVDGTKSPAVFNDPGIKLIINPSSGNFNVIWTAAQLSGGPPSPVSASDLHAFTYRTAD